MMDWYGGDWGGTIWMVLIMIVLWGGLIAVAVWAIGRLTGGDDVAFESPRQILDRRLAAGEIDAEHYGEARRLLEGRGIAPSTQYP